jgi:hypothetical protein
MEALLLGEQMAVGLIIQFSGVDAAKYDAILKEAGLKGKKAVWPAGIISHAAGPTADGWCVVDVWSSRAQYDKFLSKRLKPAFDRAVECRSPR